MSDFVTPWTAACKASLSFTVSLNLLRFLSIKSVMPSNHLILYRPLLLLPAVFPSIRVFSRESVLCIMRPECWASNSAPSFQWLFQGWFPLGWTGLISLKRLIIEFMKISYDLLASPLFLSLSPFNSDTVSSSISYRTDERFSNYTIVVNYVYWIWRPPP